LNDAPMLSVPRRLSGDDKLKKQSIIDQFAALSAEGQQTVLGYHSQIDPDPEDGDHKEQGDGDGGATADVLGIYFTNSYTVSNDASDIESAFFAQIARMNHHCLANCEVLKFDAVSNSRSVVALRDISKGEELCINYIGNCYHTLSMVRKERREYISSTFNFECQCAECTAFHRRREELRAQYGKCQEIIDEAVNNFNKKAFEAVLAASQQMVRILKSAFDGQPTVMSQCFVNAAHALLFLDEHRKALGYLKRTVEIDRTYYGKQAVFEDVEECLAKIPKKFRKDFPWKHVLQFE